jgi:hypothetical protein
MPSASAVRTPDGSLDFSGGIDSGRVPTLEGPQVKNGLKRSQLAWLTNATVRGGGILTRTGWNKVVENFAADQGLFQGAMFYTPEADVPYIIAAISGRIYRFNVWTNNSVVDITGAVALPATLTRFYFVQAERFAVIQAGDFTTKPLIRDGSVMRQSNGLFVGSTNVLLPIAQREVPPGAAMEYWQGRLWVQVGNRTFSAGDIIYGPSGTTTYQFQDALLKWQEVAYLAGGGTFNVPAFVGNIRALRKTANLDNTLGESPLYIFTTDAIYSMQVPITRTDWVTVTASNLPLQRMVQNRYGTSSDWSLVAVNTDLFYRSYDGVRSLQVAIRYMHQWGQVPLSRNENRALAFDDRALARWNSGIEFDNRLLHTILPFQTPRGVAHRGLMPLDFDLITALDERLPPAWEGMYEGIDFLQVLKSSSGGLERAFALSVSRDTTRIQVWEITNFQKFETLEQKRVSWYFETPAYTWGDVFKLKRLDGVEFWIDKILGTVNITVYYRPDQSPCWIKWHSWQECEASTSCEDVVNPVCYPTQPYCEGYRATRQLPSPPAKAERENMRPSDIGYQFQLKVEVKGWCRFRGIMLHAQEFMDIPFDTQPPPETPSTEVDL